MKKNLRKMMLLIVTMAMLLTSVSEVQVQASTSQKENVDITTSTNVQKAAKSKRVAGIKVAYNKKAKVYNGEKCTKSFIKRIKLKVYAVDSKGKRLKNRVTVKEQGDYLHAKNGKIYITFVCGKEVKKIKLNAVPVKKVSANKGVELTANKKLTEKMLKNLTFKVTWKDGKKEKFYKGAKCLDIGKKVKGKTFRVRFRVGNKVISVKFPVKKETNPTPTPEPTPTPDPVHIHSWTAWTSKGKENHVRECRTCGKKETGKHTMDEWRYVPDNADIRYCQICNYLEIRQHEHKVPEELDYTYRKSNKNGTHQLQASYVCSICEKMVTVTKEENCSYDISYEQNTVNDMHIVVKTCTTCGHEQKEQSACEYGGSWQYIGNYVEAIYCVHCKGTKTREHEHEEEPKGLVYNLKKANSDGTHEMEASFVCSVCEETVTVSRAEDCSYDISYEQNTVNDMHIVVKTCTTCGDEQKEQSACEYGGSWQYIGNYVEAIYCVHCKGTKTREHEHEEEPKGLVYNLKKANSDGTHEMEASFVCSVCEETVTVSRAEDCSYDISYEQTGVNDIHTIVKTCTICQDRKEEEGTCEPTGELKYIKVYSQIYEYYDCKLCGDWCQRRYHTDHQFADWEYRDSQTHIRYCPCVEGREIQNHNYVYDGENEVFCDGCLDSKTVEKHDHGYDTHDNMDLMDLIFSSAYAEIVDNSQIANPCPNPNEYCSRYDFMCKRCGAMYHIYYDHKFVNGVCTRTGYCGGIAQDPLVEAINP